ncbi:sialidase-like protein, partial [Trypanosoma cruzi]
MSRHVFNSTALLLLVVMICCGIGGAHAEQAGAAVDPFTGTPSVSFGNWKEFKEAGSKITSLRVPGLVKVGDDVFAVAEAQCGERNGAGSCAGIVSKHLDIRGDSMDISTSDISLFCMQLVDTAENNFGTTEVLRPTTLVLGGSVYLLLGNYSHKKPQVEGTNERGLLLVKGTVTVDGGNNKKLLWNETYLVNPQAIGYSGSLTEFLGGGGSGAVMRDGTLVFPMQAKDKDGTSVLLSMRLPKQRNKWELSSYVTGKGCRDPTLVKWEEGKDDERLFMMAHCAGGYYDVYMSTGSGVDWYTLGEPINRVWGNSRNRKGYGVQSGSTTAIIEEKEVMLITAPVYPKEENEGGNGRLHLWVTDNARVYDVGPVSRGDDDAAASSLLMKDNNKELISVYEKKKNDGAYNLVAVRLTEKLERIKEVVKTWKDLDGALQSCSFPAGDESEAKKDMCNGRVPTKGLVGFLSGNFSENTWRDEYLGVNATVTNGVRRVPNGLTFKGSGAGAVWPVGDMGQTVPYYFANNKFTLVATVSIHEVPKEGSRPIPLIGVRMNDTKSTVLFGLSYTHEKKWLAIPGNRATSKRVDNIVKWEPNETYQVVLQMDYEEWTAIVDKKKIHNKRYKKSLFNSHRISHFYIGGDSKDESATGGHVTVTNVMLYNEELWGNDLDELKASKVTIPSLGAEEQPTGQVTGTEISVAPESNIKESAASHGELTEGDTDKQGENSFHNPVLAALLSTFAGGSSVSEPATAAESEENSRSDDNAQLSKGETAQQATLNEDNNSMQRDSEVQPQDLQSAELTEVTDVEMYSGSYDEEIPEEEEEADDRSGGSTSSVGATSDMDTATETVDSEHQVQQSTEPATEGDDVRSTGTGTTGAEQSLSLEAGDGNSERTMGSDSSLTPSRTDAEPTSAEDTDDVSRTEGSEFYFEDGKEVPQTVDT